MLEIEKIMDYLRKYGFTEEEIKSFIDFNDDMFYVDLNLVISNIDFLGSKGLDQNEILVFIRSNPLMLTCSEKRKNAFEKIYVEKLSLTNENIKSMLSRNPFIYNISPIDVDNYIEKLLENFSIQDIKNMVIENPKILDTKI